MLHWLVEDLQVRIVPSILKEELSGAWNLSTKYLEVEGAEPLKDHSDVCCLLPTFDELHVLLSPLFVGDNFEGVVCLCLERRACQARGESLVCLSHLRLRFLRLHLAYAAPVLQEES